MASIVEPSAAFSAENGTHVAQHGSFGGMEGVLPEFLSGLSGWQIAVTILFVLIAYDQSTSQWLLKLLTTY